MAERLTVNEDAAGSNPAIPATLIVQDQQGSDGNCTGQRFCNSPLNGYPSDKLLVTRTMRVLMARLSLTIRHALTKLHLPGK